MAENKTQVTGASADEFLAAVDHPVRRRDALRLPELMAELTGEEPEMWGPTIVGFGRYHYKYDSGREGDSAAVGFSPRKASLSLYGLTPHRRPPSCSPGWASTRSAPAASMSTNSRTSTKMPWPS